MPSIIVKENGTILWTTRGLEAADSFPVLSLDATNTVILEKRGLGWDIFKLDTQVGMPTKEWNPDSAIADCHDSTDEELNARCRAVLGI